jgi:hypothetical protein
MVKLKTLTTSATTFLSFGHQPKEAIFCLRHFSSLFCFSPVMNAGEPRCNSNNFLCDLTSLIFFLSFPVFRRLYVHYTVLLSPFFFCKSYELVLDIYSVHVLYQGVTKRCRQSRLTNSALVYEPKCVGRG